MKSKWCISLANRIEREILDKRMLMNINEKQLFVVWYINTIFSVCFVMQNKTVKNGRTGGRGERIEKKSCETNRKKDQDYG